MSQVDWLSILGWNKDELEDLRFVGYSYIKQGKYDIAITFFEALTILSPESVYDLQTLGRPLFAKREQSHGAQLLLKRRSN